MTGGQELEPCFSCGAEVPVVDGPTHPYMLSSPGCWATFGEVLSREYSDAAYMAKHRLTVDAYAVQHPGKPERRAAVRSVALHLVSLCAVLEREVSPARATSMIQRLAGGDDGFEWLEPPDHLGDVTVARVHSAGSPEEHLEAVERWARSSWSAWAPHHGTVRGWLDDLL